MSVISLQPPLDSPNFAEWEEYLRVIDNLRSEISDFPLVANAWLEASDGAEKQRVRDDCESLKEMLAEFL